MNETFTYEWTAEDREVPALGCICKTGDIFEAQKSLGDQFVEQGLAQEIESVN